MTEVTGTGNARWLEFLADWREEARARGSKVERSYWKAHQSLSACPIQFQHPCQTTQLAGIGPTIALKLEQELRIWCEFNHQPMPERPANKRSVPAEAEEAEAGPSTGTKKKKAATKRPYIPQKRSGAYGLLVGLYLKGASNGVKLSKSDLIAAARPYSDTEYEMPSSSRTAPAPMTGSSSSGARSFYTGWSSIKTLIAKGYVVQTGNPARYTLGDEGLKIAQTLAKDAGLGATPTEQDTDTQIIEQEDEEDGDDFEDSEPRSRADFEPVIMPAGSYTIHLIVDNREKHRFGHRHEREPLAALLLDRGIDVEVRALEVGDAVWLARKIDGTGCELDEVVLDFIVERKRLDDLTSSIFDGRWRDQKFRLASSGLSQVVYLIEDHDVDNQMRKFGAQIQTALSSSQVVEKFFVERTSGLVASIDYLASMDAIIRSNYSNKDLCVIPSSAISRPTFLHTRAELLKRYTASILTSFAAFQALNSKSGGLTLREIFGKMLLCVRGMSAEKVRETLAVWPTPVDLLTSYEQANGRVNNLLCDHLDTGDQRKKIGPALSKKVAGGICIETTTNNIPVRQMIEIGWNWNEFDWLIGNCDFKSRPRLE